MDDFIKREPSAEKFFKPWFGAEEFIKGKKRFCLLLKDLPPEEIKKFPLIAERVEAVKNFRLASNRKSTKQIANKPTKFGLEIIPQKTFLVIPVVSSERRRYIPINFMSPENLCSNQLNLVRDAELYHFGILNSSIHMAWMRTVAGRLKSDYRYSATIVYNNFPWPTVTERRRRMIERSAQNILDVRADFPDWTFAKLYDEATMPDELRLAHKANDYAVALAYGFENFWEDEARVVAELMKLYKALTKA